MNSKLLSALQGAEQDPSQGFRGYPDYSHIKQQMPSSGPVEQDSPQGFRGHYQGYSPIKQETPLAEPAGEDPSQGFVGCYQEVSSSGQSDDDVEIVTTPSYRLNISGNVSSPIPLSTVHKEPQSFSRTSSVRIPKKLTPPIKHEINALPQSPPSGGHQRHNGYATMLNTTTQTSTSPQGSTIFLMTPQGAAAQVAALQQRVSQNRVAQNVLQSRCSQNVVPSNRAPQNVASNRVHQNVAQYRAPQNAVQNRVRSPVRQTFEPYVPVMQTSPENVPHGTVAVGSMSSQGRGRAGSVSSRGTGRAGSLSSRGTGRAGSLSSRGTGRGTVDGGRMPSRGTGRGRGQSSRGRGRSLRGNATGLNLSQYGTRYASVDVLKCDSPEGRQLAELLLRNHTNPRSPHVRQASPQQNNMQPRTIVYRIVQQPALVMNNSSATAVTHTSIPVATPIVNSSSPISSPVLAHATTVHSATNIEVISDSDSNSPLKSNYTSRQTPPQVPPQQRQLSFTSVKPTMSANVVSSGGRLQIVSPSVPQSSAVPVTSFSAISSSVGGIPIVSSSTTPTTVVMSSAVSIPSVVASQSATRPSMTTSQPTKRKPAKAPKARKPQSASRKPQVVRVTQALSSATESLLLAVSKCSPQMRQGSLSLLHSSQSSADLSDQSPSQTASKSSSQSSQEVAVKQEPSPEFVMEQKPSPEFLAAQNPSQELVVKQEPEQELVAEQKTSQESVAEQKDSQELVVKQEPSQELVAKQEPSQELVAKQEPSQELVAKQEPSQELVAKQEPSQEVVAKQEPSQELVAEQKPSQGSVAEQTSKQECVAKQKPSQESAVEGHPSPECAAEGKPSVDQEKGIPEKPPRPKSPEIPDEFADKEGLCPYCGSWSANLKKCESCNRILFYGKKKIAKYRKKGENDVILYPPYEPSTKVKEAAEKDSPKIIIITKSQSDGDAGTRSKGVGTNKFYSQKLDSQFEVYKNTSGPVRMTNRGGGRGNRRGRGRGRGRQPAKRPEPELIAISSDEEDVDSGTSAPSSRPVTPAATPIKNAMATSESQQSNGSSIDSSSDAEVCRTPPVKRKAKMRDQDGNTPITSAPITVSPEVSLQHKKAFKKEIIDCQEEEVTQVSQVIPVVESMDVCLLRFGSWTPSVINPVVFQSNCIMFNFSAAVDHCSQLRLEAKDITLCQYNLKKSMPTIFLYTTPKFAMVVRERLKMNRSSGPFFDPKSSDDSEKRVIIRPMNDLDQTQCTRIMQAFDGMAFCTNRLKSVLFEELDKETVNRLLVCSKPSEHIQPFASSPQASIVRNRMSVEPTANEDGTITVRGQKNRIVTLDPTTFKVTSVKEAPGGGSSTENMENNAEEGEVGEVIMRRILGPCVTLFIYPPPPSTGGITVTSDDLACLDEGEFLNDVIIDFYLKYLMAEKLSKVDKKRTHIFSSFFYKRLMQREYGRYVQNPELSAIEKRHNRVRKWTRNVDLFEKDFIIIPINESAHWYVAVICYPGKVITPEWQSRSNKYTEGSEASDSPSPSPPNICSEAEADSTPSETANALGPPTLSNQCDGAGGSGEPTSANVRRSDEEEPMDVDGENSDGSQPMEIQQTTSAIEETADDATLQESASGTWEIQDSQCSSTSGGSQAESAQPSPSASVVFSSEERARRFQRPCILIFDSLRGPSRRHVIQMLREYLAMEWQTRKKSNCVFDGYTIRGQTPEVPQQSNYSDCGVFVLQYVETFFQKPITNFNIPLRNLGNWFSEEAVNRKRREMQDLIEELKESWKMMEEDR